MLTLRLSESQYIPETEKWTANVAAVASKGTRGALPKTRVKSILHVTPRVKHVCLLHTYVAQSWYLADLSKGRNA